MKHILTLILTIGIFTVCFAQPLQLIVNVDPNPSPAVLDWAANPNTVTMQVINTTAEVHEYKVKASISKDGKLVAQIDLVKSPMFSIDEFSTEMAFVEDIFPASSVDIVDQSIKDQYLITNKFPGGNYQLCVELVQVDDFNRSLSKEVCRPFRIVDYNLSQLILPLNKSEHPAEVPILFQWTKITPAYNGIVAYTFKIFQIKSEQTALRAFEDNQPLVSEEDVMQESFLWTPDLLQGEEGTSYVWSVQARDGMTDDLILSDEGRDGWAPFYTFKLKEEDKNTRGSEPEGEGEGGETAETKSGEPEGENPGTKSAAAPPTSGGVATNAKYDDYTECNCVPKLNVRYRDNINYIPTKVQLDWIDEAGSFQSRCTKPVLGPEDQWDQDIWVDWGDGSIKEVKNYYTSVPHNYDSVEDIPEEICITYYFKWKYEGEKTWNKCYVNHCVPTGDDDDDDDDAGDDDNTPAIECLVNAGFTKIDSSNLYWFYDNSSAKVGGSITAVSWTVDEVVVPAGDSLMQYWDNKGSYNVCRNVTGIDTDGNPCTESYCEVIKIGRDCTCDPEVPVSCSPPSTATFAVGDTILLADGLVLELTEDISGTASNLSGKGLVYVPWLFSDVNVDFSGISVNASNQFCGGEFYATHDDSAPVYPTQVGINMGVQFTEGIVEDLDTWVNGLPQGDKVDLGDMASGAVAPVSVPIGVNNAEGYTLAISVMQFKPERNKMSATCATPIDFSGNNKIDFVATNIVFNANSPMLGLGCGGGFDLLTEKTIWYTTNNEDPSGDPANWFSITFNAPAPGRLGTGIEWVSSCTDKLNWCFRADVDFSMPRKWLLPIPDDGFSQVETNVQTEICNWEDWIIMMNLPKSTLAGSNGLELEVTELTYDGSSLRNAFQMEFPENYVGETSELYEGFWLKQAKLIFPKKFTTYSDTTRRVEVQLNDWVINKEDGFTGEALGINLINYPDANIADLGASIDSVKLNMINSAFTEAYMTGKILIPLTNADTANAFTYKGIFGTGNANSFDGFNFNISPDSNIVTEFFGDAELTIFNTSEMDITLTPTETDFDIDLNGEIDFPTEINHPLAGTITGLQFITDFNGLGVDWNDTGFNFQIGNWGLSSPQKKISKFPVTLENFRQVTKSPGAGELYAGGFAVDAVVNLDKEKIGGQTTLEFIGAFTKPPGQRIQPKFKKVGLSSISIYANLPAIKMDGTIDFINNDPVWGNGVKGDLNAKFNSINTYINVGAFFGNTDYGSATRYRYWKAEAKAILPAPGIVFLPGLAFRGFGAAAYRHMSATYPSAAVSAASLGAVSNSTTSGATFTPDKDISFGFRIEAILASTPKEESFNGDVGISGEFSSSGGMTFLRFDGDFYVGAGFAKRADAITSGTVVAQYDFPTKEFYLGAGVNINKYPITTPSPVGLSLYINGSTNKWYFKAGEPNNPNVIKVFNVNTFSYVMFGNDIYAPSGFMPATVAGYAAATKGGGLGSLNSGAVVNSSTTSGKGFAFGTGLTSSDAGTKHLVGRLSADYSYGIGGELNLSLMEYAPGCITGMNGWYAKGGIALFGGFNLNLIAAAKGKTGGCTNSICAFYCCKNYPSGKVLPIGGAGFGVWAVGAFPKPTYLTGGLDLTYNIIGLSGSYHADFEVGNYCAASPVGNTTVFTQEDAAAAQQTELIKTLSPSGFNVEESTSLKGQFGFVPDEAFDVPEQQSDGTVINRTFQAKYVASLQKEVGGSWTGEAIYYKGLNVLGQHEYSNEMASLSSGPASMAGGISLGGGSLGGAPLGLSTAPASSPSAGMAMAAPKSPSLGAAPSPSPGGMAAMAPMAGAPLMTPYGSGPGTGGGATDSGADYGNLPPPPPPVVNNLTADTNYKFKVVATLYEYINGSWVIAKNSSNQNVIETKEVSFRTGAMQLAGASNAASQFVQPK